MSSDDATLDTALALCQQAHAVAAKLKHGSYDSVQALALTSIAHSLAVIAASSRRP